VAEILRELWSRSQHTDVLSQVMENQWEHSIKRKFGPNKKSLWIVDVPGACTYLFEK